MLPKINAPHQGSHIVTTKVMPTEEEAGGDGGGDCIAGVATLNSQKDTESMPPYTSDSGTSSRSGSRQESARVADSSAAESGRRRSSFIVYPEAGDIGKPKVFARQSFVVSGEEEEMAETILKARQIAGERRRSTAEIDRGDQGTIAAVAQNLAARRDSVIKQPTSVDADLATGGGDAKASTVDTEEERAVARRRSSVMNRIPDNLRALVQQSDASGVQQKTPSPRPEGREQATTAAAEASLTGRKPSDGTNSSTTAGATGPLHQQRGGFFHHFMAFVRWKGKTKERRNSKDKKTPRKGSGGSGGGGVDSSHTATGSPMPGSDQNAPALLPRQLPKFAGRKKLILDLDETLVHSSFKPVPGADYIMDIQVDSTYYKVFVLKRPGVDEFLERVAKLYEVVIFTASLPQYANPLLDLLDTKKTITSRLFREHCTFHEGYFVKDLTLLRHESLESTIIVDNSPMAYMFQPENAIDCISWIDQQDDTELYVIADFLETIVSVPDVRDLLEFWREGASVLDNC